MVRPEMMYRTKPCGECNALFLDDKCLQNHILSHEDKRKRPKLREQASDNSVKLLHSTNLKEEIADLIKVRGNFINTS